MFPDRLYYGWNIRTGSGIRTEVLTRMKKTNEATRQDWRDALKAVRIMAATGAAIALFIILTQQMGIR